MSLQTWKDEFYPLAVEKTTKATALWAVIRKWEGLRQENLDRHGVLAGVNTVMEKGTVTELPFPIGAASCAFCHHYLREPEPPEDPDEDPTDEWRDKSDCDECPLYQIRGGYSCDKEREDEAGGSEGAPWTAWWCRHDPEPMLRWLYKIRGEGVPR